MAYINTKVIPGKGRQGGHHCRHQLWRNRNLHCSVQNIPGERGASQRKCCLGEREISSTKVTTKRNIKIFRIFQIKRKKALLKRMHSVYFGAVSIEIEDYDTGYKIALPMLLNQLKPSLNLMKCSEGRESWRQQEEK